MANLGSVGRESRPLCTVSEHRDDTERPLSFPTDETTIRHLMLLLVVDRDTVFTLCVAALAIVALGAAAATLETAVTLGGGEGGSGIGSVSVDDGTGSGPSAGPLPPGGFAGTFDPICFPILRGPLALSVMGLAFLGSFALIYRYLQQPFSAAVVSGVVAMPVVGIWMLLAFCGQQPTPAAVDSGPGISPTATNETWIPFLNGGGTGEASGTVLSAPSVVVFVLAGIALVGTAIVLFAGRGDDTVGPDAAEPAPVTDPDVAAVARAAGRAADRIASDAAVDNEVFRAWAAMTDALDLESPETVTPAAFEAAAVDAGMTPDDVAELRRLFEEVRYGGQSPSDERERQAVSALRRIEDEYGDLDANAEDH